MFEKSVNAAKVCKERAKTALDNYKRERKNIESSYINDKLTEHFATAREEYEREIDRIVADAMNVVKADFDGIMAKIDSIASEPVKPELLQTCEAIRHIEQPTKREIDRLMSAIGGNYLGYRAICGAIGGRIHGYNCILLDDVIDYVNQSEQALKAVIYGVTDGNSVPFSVYGIDSYMSNLITAGHYLKRYDAIVTAFCNRKFDFVYMDD